MIPQEKGRRGRARAIERQNKAAHTSTVPRKEKQKETLKARETIYTTAPEQSTDNREPHTIRTTHHAPHETRKQADERAMEIGKKGKRRSWDIGSN